VFESDSSPEGVLRGGELVDGVPAVAEAGRRPRLIERRRVVRDRDLDHERARVWVERDDSGVSSLSAPARQALARACPAGKRPLVGSFP